MSRWSPWRKLRDKLLVIKERSPRRGSVPSPATGCQAIETGDEVRLEHPCAIQTAVDRRGRCGLPHMLQRILQAAGGLSDGGGPESHVHTCGLLAVSLAGPRSLAVLRLVVAARNGDTDVSENKRRPHVRWHSCKP